MLRVELSPNGAFNVPEFGTVEDADQCCTSHLNGSENLGSERNFESVNVFRNAITAAGRR